MLETESHWKWKRRFGLHSRHKSTGVLGPELPRKKMAGVVPGIPTQTVVCSEPIGHPRTHWLRTSVLLIASLLGAGVLSLPEALAHLGWLLGSISFAAFAMMSGYCGGLLSRLKVAVPNAVVYGDLGKAAYGDRGKLVVYAVQYIYMMSVCVVFHLGSAQALQSTIEPLVGKTALWIYSLAVFILCFPLCMVRTLHEVAGPISVVGIITILASLFIVISCLSIKLFDDGDHGLTNFLPKSSLDDTISALLVIVFAYGGAELMVEMLSEMENPAHFTKSINFSFVILIFFYYTVGGLGYGVRGSAVTSPITSAFIDSKSTLSMVTNASLFIHLCTGKEYSVRKSDAAISIMEELDSEEQGENYPDRPAPSANKVDSVSNENDDKAYISDPLLPRDKSEDDNQKPAHSHSNNNYSNLVWVLTSIWTLAFSGVVCVVIPFFSDLQAWIGAIGTAATSFTFPLVFSVRLLPPKGMMGRMETILCYILIILAFMLHGIGLYSSTANIIKNSEHYWN